MSEIKTAQAQTGQARLREEFEIVANLGNRADIDSAMLVAEAHVQERLAAAPSSRVVKALWQVTNMCRAFGIDQQCIEDAERILFGRNFLPGIEIPPLEEVALTTAPAQPDTLIREALESTVRALGSIQVEDDAASVKTLAKGLQLDLQRALAGAAHGWREIEPSADLREIRSKDERVNLKPNEEWPPRRFHNAKEAVRWYMSYVEKHCYPEKTSALEYLATHGDPYVVLENIIDDGMRYAQEDNRKEVIEECAQFLEKEAAENRIRNPNNGKAEHLSVIYEHKANCLRALASAPQSAGGE